MILIIPVSNVAFSIMSPNSTEILEQTICLLLMLPSTTDAHNPDRRSNCRRAINALDTPKRTIYATLSELCGVPVSSLCDCAYSSREMRKELSSSTSLLKKERLL
jgi:hypothetical protein